MVELVLEKLLGFEDPIPECADPEESKESYNYDTDLEFPLYPALLPDIRNMHYACINNYGYYAVSILHRCRPITSPPPKA